MEVLFELGTAGIAFCSLVLTCFVARPLLQDLYSQADWQLPMWLEESAPLKGRWLRYFFATVCSILVLPIIFLFAFLLLWGLALCLLLILGSLVSLFNQ
jgi:hypothetical protein